jgi:hypothetical protein
MKRAELAHLDTTKRPTRIPIDGARDILAIPNKDPAYRYTWQHEAEVNRFLLAGYECVTDETMVGEPTVNTSSRINAPTNALVLRYKGDTLYAMKTPVEFWNEDEHRREAERRKVEIQMGTINPGEYGKVQIGKVIP